MIEKAQQGNFNYNADLSKLRIDYLESRTEFSGNMTEIFYHEGNKVHPHITRYPGLGDLHGAACPCIDVGTGIVSHTWAEDAQYLGRELLGIEFIWQERLVDHYIKGPHHVWVDVETSKVIRMWQPYNGLEVFDPFKWKISPDATSEEDFDLPTSCKVLSAVCINGTSASAVVADIAMALYSSQDSAPAPGS